MKRFQRKKHKIGTYEIKTISLSCFDDKKFVLDDEIHTLDYFTKEIHTDSHKKKRFSQMVTNKNGCVQINS